MKIKMKIKEGDMGMGDEGKLRRRWKIGDRR